MASTCISSCVNDARAPVRATFLSVYKWPESDAEFVRSVSSKRLTSRAGGGPSAPPGCGHPRVVDSISCRQLYLRSYTFSRKESMPEKTKKCLGRVRDRVSVSSSISSGGGVSGSRGQRRKSGTIKRAKEVSCSAFLSIFRRLLSCTTKIDVVG